MLEERSAWRANDAGAYEAMRNAAITVIALLIRDSRRGLMESSRAVAEASSIRREVFQIDGYDRSAVDALKTRLDSRAIDLATASR